MQIIHEPANEACPECGSWDIVLMVEDGTNLVSAWACGSCGHDG